MQIQRPACAREFLDAVGSHLFADEIRHSLAYGIASRVAADAHAFGPLAPWFLMVQEETSICASAIRTPPHGVIISHFRGDLDAVCAELIRSIRGIDVHIPGVVGEKTFADRFTQGWCATGPASVSEVMHQRIYRLSEVIRPPLASGTVRKAVLGESELIESWTEAFGREALGSVPNPAHRELNRGRILSGNVHIWEDRVPVSMAMTVRPTRNGISVGGVYTPPEYRNRGYATSCVASLCEMLLRDYRFCVLYTNLSNPVSNSIYQKIGFHAYCDSAQYTFAPRDG